jgi:hypothetical protein
MADNAMTRAIGGPKRSSGLAEAALSAMKSAACGNFVVIFVVKQSYGQ